MFLDSQVTIVQFIMIDDGIGLRGSVQIENGINMVHREREERSTGGWTDKTYPNFFLYFCDVRSVLMKHFSTRTMLILTLFLLRLLSGCPTVKMI